jgi:hypothetical protein
MEMPGKHEGEKMDESRRDGTIGQGRAHEIEEEVVRPCRESLGQAV